MSLCPNEFTRPPHVPHPRGRPGCHSAADVYLLGFQHGPDGDTCPGGRDDAVRARVRGERVGGEGVDGVSVGGRKEGDEGMGAVNAEAVRGLKRKRVVEDRGESCRVCWEEFVKGEKVTCIPCGHVFPVSGGVHQDLVGD
ncbi:hypothetical protein RHMOL_Rhmol12G0065100 [Rhododendron molle]|uniref:Uncharacterized protein n=1 Tax=Rhododendron molle TaxID=49168 RepID=A0ACC0LEW9_RHOML|nr:hypothetical protein RHMOL_Rhmol12G0065100 [Rhododendron molle]